MNVMVYMLHSFKGPSIIKVQDTMKTLSTETLNQFGFTEDPMKSNQVIKVFSKGKFEIVFKENAFYYSYMGIDYPLQDVAALKKLYKENCRTELVPVK